MSKKSFFAQKIRTSITNAHYYLESVSSNIIMIYDYNGTSYILKQDNATSGYEVEFTTLIQRNAVFFFTVTNLPIPVLEDKTYQIINSDPIYFIPIDGVNGISKGKTSHCDFIFFNNANFCFVEMKLNATSLNPQPIRKNRKKAVKQLKSTIDYFDKKLSKNYSGLILEAYVATPDIYPRENTAFQSIKVQFLENTGVSLYESREKKY